MKRMYGEFNMGPEYGEGDGPPRSKKRKRAVPKPGVPDPHSEPETIDGGMSFFSKLRTTRQNFRNNQSSDSGR